jgi:hypothetical protein
MARLILFILSGMLLLGGSTVSYSQTKDLLKLKCTNVENQRDKEITFYYELDLKKPKYIIVAHIYNKKVVRTNVSLLENKKFSKNNLIHLDEKIVKVEDKDGKFDLTRSHLISFDRMNVLLIAMGFVKEDKKPNDIETFKLSCEEISTFPKFALDKK